MIRSNQSVKGSFIIDPSLQIPPSLLAPLAYGETDYSRKNLRVESRNGSVEIDVSVTTRNPEVKAGKVSMYVRSSNGSVSTRLVNAILTATLQTLMAELPDSMTPSLRHPDPDTPCTSPVMRLMDPCRSRSLGHSTVQSLSLSTTAGRGSLIRLILTSRLSARLLGRGGWSSAIYEFYT